MKCVAAGLIVLGCAFGVGAAHQTGPDWMDCRQTVVVRYHPGAKWADFDKHVAGHLAFLRKQMEAGELLYAGPFEDQKGGISIYRSSDLAELDRRIRQDPAVAHGVVTYSMSTWRMCSLRKTTQDEASRAPDVGKSPD